MRAAPHLLQRLRRWLALRALRARCCQLELQIHDLRQVMGPDAAALPWLQAQLNATRSRLHAAQQAPRCRARLATRTGD